MSAVHYQKGERNRSRSFSPNCRRINKIKNDVDNILVEPHNIRYRSASLHSKDHFSCKNSQAFVKKVKSNLLRQCEELENTSNVMKILPCSHSSVEHCHCCSFSYDIAHKTIDVKEHDPVLPSCHSQEKPFHISVSCNQCLLSTCQNCSCLSGSVSNGDKHVHCTEFVDISNKATYSAKKGIEVDNAVGQNLSDSSITSRCVPCTPCQVDQIRRRLKFFFMDPWSKYKARRHIPWKLFLQLLKTIILTIQLIRFGNQRSLVMNFFKTNDLALEHLMLKDWNPSYETLPYPPATGRYALYSTSDLLDAVQFSWQQYYNLSHLSIVVLDLYKNNTTGIPLPMNMCVRFQNYSEFPNNSYIIHSGQVLQEVVSERTRCIALDVCVMSICLLSCLLCTRSLLRAWKLERIVENMFLAMHQKKLLFSERMEFVSLWYLIIIVNDICTVIGSVYKIRLEMRTAPMTSRYYDMCGVMLGIGGLFSWTGGLRYFSFFRQYNILILTLKTAFPSILRFMVCTLAIYAGFTLCGWVILSPYHIKFRYLSTTSECLFSLLNGDDMFVTFSATESDNVMIWYFSRIFLYSFISLFIYCVLSLFLAVIMDTHERLKDYYEHGLPRSDLRLFIEDCHDSIQSGLYSRKHTEDDANDCSLIECITKCCCRLFPGEMYG